MRAVKKTHPRGTAAAFNQRIGAKKPKPVPGVSWWIGVDRATFQRLALERFPEASAPVNMAFVTSPDGRCDRDG